MTDEKTDPQSQLKCLYASLEKTVSKFDPEMQEKMNIAEQNFIGKLRLRLKDLDRENCGIVLTGEVSAGKTMLMNLLVGKRIMKPANHPSTKNVYRIHNRKEFKITYSTIEGELIHQKNYETEKALLKELRDYKEEKKCIDIFLPLPSLKGNIVLIDTPGVGYTSEYDNIIKAVIPHAVAFVFVANLGSAGGFQEGRLLKIINDIENQIGQMPCFDQHDVIFLMNKYDQVGEHEREEVMNNAVENLHKVWPYVAFAHENMMFISLKEVVSTQTSTSNPYNVLSSVTTVQVNYTSANTPNTSEAAPNTSE
ncbi:uncharacterized protein in xynA 3'region-like, partial [Saccostrea cucullata]|uniref:uncharacterized protein in xynA 3'region-like n=1 Tax=Saccostrea cuccullata TaxID=36930 RepID=UPI002ED1F8CE